MAKILTKQKSLYKNTIINFGVGISLFAIGYSILQKNLLVGMVILCISSWFILRGSNFLKGSFGELKVTAILSELPDDYFVFNDIVVEGSQIDHALICPKGIYTIETKNWRGTVYGNSKDKDWSLVTRDRNNRYHKYVEYSPVMQGKKHSVNFNKYLKKNDLGDYFVKTIVIFTHQEIDIKVYSPDIPVLYSSQLFEYINSQNSCISNDVCKPIVDHLKATFLIEEKV